VELQQGRVSFSRFHEKASLVNYQFMSFLGRLGDARIGPWIVPPRFHPHSS
jgi:hypothetical protein